MNQLSLEEEIQLLKNILEDPNDWISARILQINEELMDISTNIGLK
jgi:hypothetical protein